MSRCRIVLSSGAFVRDLHVSGVAEVDARLVGTLVAAVLQRDDTLTRSHLLLAELSHVLVSLLGSNAGQTGTRVSKQSVHYSYYRLEFEAPPQLVTQIPDVLCRDVDVLRSRIYKLRLPVQQECTIFEETKPPAYRPEVQQMIEIGKRKVKKRFNPNTGLPVTPFQR
ncbi:hypothetical protein B566_EDAN007081 [Ephemera danica]|nr:hypothetical protein B566_EDAN007081 [Ephemera danica]